MDFTEYSKFLIAMLAIVDPLAILPIYAQMTQSLTDVEKARLARRAAMATTIALIVAVFLGQHILNFFGISIASFRIAGGLLLMIIAFQLLYFPVTSKDSDPGNLPLDTQIVVPLAIPLLAGPGAFSTVIVFTFRNEAWWHPVLICVCLLILGLVIWLSLLMAGKILRYVSPTAIAITLKVMGLIMVAIAVEFIANGVRQLINT